MFEVALHTIGNAHSLHATGIAAFHTRTYLVYPGGVHTVYRTIAADAAHNGMDGNNRRIIGIIADTNHHLMRLHMKRPVTHAIWTFHIFYICIGQFMPWLYGCSWFVCLVSYHK